MPRQARIDAPGALHHIIIRYKSILCEEDRYLKQTGSLHSSQPFAGRDREGC